MVQIAGKYQLVENKNFQEFLSGIGIPEKQVKELIDFKEPLEVKLDGNKITLVNDIPPDTTNMTLGEEIEERMPDGVVLLTTATLNGNVLTITSKTKDGKPVGLRTNTFSDTGLEVVVQANKDGKTYSATRVFKRI